MWWSNVVMFHHIAWWCGDVSPHCITMWWNFITLHDDVVKFHHIAWRCGEILPHCFWRGKTKGLLWHDAKLALQDWKWDWMMTNGTQRPGWRTNKNELFSRLNVTWQKVWNTCEWTRLNEHDSMNTTKKWLNTNDMTDHKCACANFLKTVLPLPRATDQWFNCFEELTDNGGHWKRNSDPEKHPRQHLKKMFGVSKMLFHWKNCWEWPKWSPLVGESDLREMQLSLAGVSLVC